MPTSDENTSSAWVITPQKKLIEVNSHGQKKEISDAGFTSDVSQGADGIIWVIRANQSNKHISFSEDHGATWTDIPDLEIKAQKLAATHLGNCMILTPQGSVHLLHKDGRLDQVFKEDTAQDIAISPEGWIWVVSRQKKESGGNLVFWCSTNNLSLQPASGQPVAKRISAGPGGSARSITVGGEVCTIPLMGMAGLETPGGEQFAKSIAVSHSSNTIWVIGSDNSSKKKKNVLKYWNPDVHTYMDWQIIEGIEPFQISGGT